MKQIVFSISLLVAFFGFAQDDTTKEDTAKQNWFHSDYTETGIYGVGDDQARAFLESKGLKPQTIVVGVLDSGVEIDHDDLKNNIWVNTGEIPDNGIDDDKNGYIDDVHGWDFIGGPNGKVVNDDTLEMTRIVKQFTPVFEGENEQINSANKSKMPETYQMYLDAKEAYDEATKESWTQAEFFKQLIQMLNPLIEKYSADQKINSEFAKGLSDPAEQQLFEGIAQSADMTLGELKEYSEEESQVDSNPMYDLDFDPRSIVGDDYSDPWQQYYGNNVYEGPDAMHGTHVAGIIAAERNNETGMNGIAGDVAKIMVVRTVPNGDERDKDVANSIRYAADNGAKIMNMSFGKDFSPYKEVVWKAIDYADNKGVLMFHAAGNDNKDVDTEPNFPTNFRNDKSFTKNWVTVGASTRDNDKLRAGFSNYGKERVDLFAPGAEIYATVTDNEYRYLQGTSMASPAAAGCAALLWAYFPELTATEIRELLMESTNSNDTVQTVGDTGLKVPFNELSVSGGVIDVNKAAHLAYKKYGHKKSNN